MSLFHRVKIKEVIKETPDAATIVFDIPGELQDQFKYKAGQYVTVSFEINGKEERRAYSFCTSPYTDASPAVTVKKVPNGTVSPLINDSLKAGETIMLMPPMGKFTTEFNPAAGKHYMLYGGGSGITPIMSILKSVLYKEPESFVTLVYANRDENSIIFRSLLNDLKAQYGDRLTVFYSLDNAPVDWEGHAGMMGAEEYRDVSHMLEQPGMDTEYFICGPSGMMDQVKKGLEQMRVSAEKIHSEYFTTPAGSKPAPPPTPIPVEEDEDGDLGECEATILFGGKEYHITIPLGETVLEAAIDQDVDPPYACQMGVCTTCRAKMLEGKVSMDEREGLSDSEIAEGYVLTCQSHPGTKKIKLIYE